MKDQGIPIGIEQEGHLADTGVDGVAEKFNPCRFQPRPRLRDVSDP